MDRRLLTKLKILNQMHGSGKPHSQNPASSKGSAQEFVKNANKPNLPHVPEVKASLFEEKKWDKQVQSEFAKLNKSIQTEWPEIESDENAFLPLNTEGELKSRMPEAACSEMDGCLVFTRPLGPFWLRHNAFFQLFEKYWKKNDENWII